MSMFMLWRDYPAFCQELLIIIEEFGTEGFWFVGDKAHMWWVFDERRMYTR